MSQDTYFGSQPDHPMRTRRNCALNHREPATDLTSIIRQLCEDLDAAKVRLLALKRREAGRPIDTTKRPGCLLLVAGTIACPKSAPRGGETEKRRLEGG
jgi:hypothetical protein